MNQPIAKKRPSRFTIDLLEGQTALLNDLRENTGLTSTAIFRRGLKMLSWAEQQKAQGRRIVAVDSAGAIYPQEPT